MEVIKDFNNELLKRREVKAIINAEQNPGMDSAIKMVAEKFKADEGAIVLNTLKSKFGRDTFLVDALVYNSAADRESMEPKKREKKKEAQ